MLSEPPATPRAEALYEADRTSDGYVMNLTRVWAWRPEVAESFQATRAMLTSGSALTPRERAVLALMAEGRSNAGIAAALVITPGVVEKHVASIFAKLGLPPSDSDNRRVLAVLRHVGG